LLVGSTAVLGVSLAGTATACRHTQTQAVEVTARSVLAQLSATAAPAANTDALNAAIRDASASGADVIVPGGEYGFNGMTIPAGGRVKIRGAGSGITVLQNSGDGPSIAAHGVPGTSSYLSDWGVSDLTLTAPGRRDGQAGLSVRLASRFSVRDVSVLNHGVGVRHEAAWNCGYDGLSVTQSGIGWLFPSTNFAGSTPVGILNCSGSDCDTAVLIEDAVDAMAWVGGDFAGCGRGLVVYGDQSRSISFHGINFERVRDEDIVVGDDKTGPSALTFSGCRFWRDEKGDVSVRIVRGDGIAFYSSRWTNYRRALDQASKSGSLVMVGCTGFEVDQWNARDPRVRLADVLNATTGDSSIRLSLRDTSVLPAVMGTEGVTTKVLSGQGRRTVADGDFAVAPKVGCMCVLYDTTDGSVRHGIRAETGWHVSAPYLPPAS
jgi:hypothetical protein